jgi:hypothetical protein
MTMERTAWLFIRDHDSVRLEIIETGNGVRLSIEGPAEARSNYDFPAGTSVEGFRQDYENKLMADGYRLQIVSERRNEDLQHAPTKDRRRRRREDD